jgi:cephalosporin-C deacetylase-like acetyl esterase
MTSEPIPADAAVSLKYAAFDLVDVNYKEAKGVPIPASILVPKNVKPGKHPVLVRWHGGCLITGHRLFPEW